MRTVTRNLTLASCCFISLIFTLNCQAAPPKVVKAVPDDGDIDVDPGLREITITFDQAMDKGGQSIVGGGESFPQLMGKQPGKWKNARTFVLRVRLKPNHSYWISVNSQRFQNFRNRQGEPAIPYPISFTTGASEGGVDTTLEKNADNVAAVDQLKQALATQYSFRDRLGIDWPALIESKRGQLDAAPDTKAFAQLAATLLSKAQDKHLWFMVGEEQFPTYVRPVTPNVNVERLSELVPAWKEHSSVLASGSWEDGVGYVRIDTWDRSKTRELAPVFDILEELKDEPALIIDVRLNGGGDERIARSVAGCFIDEPALYAKHVLVDADQPSGFSEPHERLVQPNAKRAAYRGKVAVLTGPVNMSSCEAFLLMMKQVARCCARWRCLAGKFRQSPTGGTRQWRHGLSAVLESHDTRWQRAGRRGHPTRHSSQRDAQ